MTADQSPSDETATPEVVAETVAFGAAVRDVTPDLAQRAGLPAPFGVEVGPVKPDSCAETAGVRPGDVITHIGAYTLAGGADQFGQAVAARRPKDTMVITVWRDRSRHVLTISFP
jgi:S1-C subfamily serine protease